MHLFQGAQNVENQTNIFIFFKYFAIQVDHTSGSHIVSTSRAPHLGHFPVC